MNDHIEPRTQRPYDRRSLRSVPSLVLVNTGHGKGKSTAAFGTLMRSEAREWPADVVTTLKGRPKDVSVVLTGREMPQQVIDVADTVTEMVPVKPAFQQGIRARRGIDY